MNAQLKVVRLVTSYQQNPGYSTTCEMSRYTGPDPAGIAQTINISRGESWKEVKIVTLFPRLRKMGDEFS